MSSRLHILRRENEAYDYRFNITAVQLVLIDPGQLNTLLVSDVRGGIGWESAYLCIVRIGENYYAS